MQDGVASGYGDGNDGKHVCAGTGQGSPFASWIGREKCEPKVNKAMANANIELILNRFINFFPG